MTKVYMQGTILRIYDTAGTTPIVVGSTYSMSGFDGEAPDNDDTTFASTAREYSPGLQDNGNVSFDLFREHSDPGQVECLAARAAQEKRKMEVEYEDGHVDNFEGFVKSLSKTGERGGRLTGTLNIRISGEVT